MVQLSHDGLLARYFSLSERFSLNLQARYDLEIEKIVWLIDSLLR